MLLWRNNAIIWNKEMSAHELREICEIKLLTKHLSLPHTYLVVSKRQWTYTPCNKIANEKQNKEKKTNKLRPPSKKIPLSLQHSYTCLNALLFIFLWSLFQESAFWSSCNRWLRNGSISLCCSVFLLFHRYPAALSLFHYSVVFWLFRRCFVFPSFWFYKMPFDFI